MLLYLDKFDTKNPTFWVGFFGGRGWDRTSYLNNVNVAL